RRDVLRHERVDGRLDVDLERILAGGLDHEAPLVPDPEVAGSPAVDAVEIRRVFEREVFHLPFEPRHTPKVSHRPSIADAGAGRIIAAVNRRRSAGGRFSLLRNPERGGVGPLRGRRTERGRAVPAPRPNGGRLSPTAPP